MNRELCPVCNASAETGHPGDALQVDCPRCGRYVISGTAMSMLKSRLHENTTAVARASHAIHVRSADQDWFQINSTNIDELTTQPLPAPDQQLANLLVYLKRKTGDHHFSPIALTDLENIASAVGTVDRDALIRLLHWAKRQRLLRFEGQGDRLILTPEAWLPGATKPLLPTAPKAAPDQPSPKQTRLTNGHCPNCGGSRKAEVAATHQERWDDYDAMVWAVDTYNILKCRGCNTVYVQREHIFSENIEHRETADGEWEEYCDPAVTYWPAPAKRDRPEWLNDLEDDSLRAVLTEVYGALDSDHRILAAIGARTALDRAMTLLNATENNFPGKLNELKDKGMVSDHEKDNLLVLTDAGSASAHRAWQPTPTNIATVMSGMESFLHRTLVFGKEISLVRKDIPSRPKRQKS